MNPLVIYHSPCADGFTAAWVVKKAYPEAELFAGSYGAPPPDVTGRDVIIVDFSYKRHVLEEMIGKCNSMLILDHHKTALEDLAGVENLVTAGLNQVHCIFDMNRSGAMIAWDYFNNDAPPTLVEYVQDRDLWRFNLNFCKEIAAYIFSHDYTLENWTNIAGILGDDEDSFFGAVGAGRAILRKQDKDIQEMLANCTRTMVIGGQEIKVANLPYTLASDAGNILAKQSANGMAGTYFDSAKGRKFSLRSVGDVDVAKVAERYGGGGHKNASGFTVPLGWEGDF